MKEKRRWPQKANFCVSLARISGLRHTRSKPCLTYVSLSLSLSLSISVSLSTVFSVPQQGV